MKKLATTMILTFLLLNIIILIPVSLGPDHEKKNQIKVMTYNIHQYYTSDYVPPSEKTGDYNLKDVLRVIQSVDPDIIGLQESEGARISSGNVQGVGWLAEQLGMNYYYGPSTDEQIYGIAILSKWKITSNEYKILPRPEGIERAVAKVTIDSPFGELSVFNTHFEIDRFKEAQRQSANQLIKYVGDEEAIILGDFNTRADLNDEAYHILNSTFTYAMIESGYHPNASLGDTAPAIDPQHKIDYIWLTQDNWKVFPNSFQVVGNQQASDHLAVVVGLTPI